MDKITRILLMYTKLLQGKPLNKVLFCLETESQPRSFDRDIEDIRLFFSETYDHRVLVYDRISKQYTLSEKQIPPLDFSELSLILRMFHDTSVLSGDEFHHFSQHLNDQDPNNKDLALYTHSLQENYMKPPHSQSILKMHSDLQKVIALKLVIRLKLLSSYQADEEIEVLPCCVHFQGKNIVLVGLNSITMESSTYFLEQIDSFTILREQSVYESEQVVISNRTINQVDSEN